MAQSVRRERRARARMRQAARRIGEIRANIAELERQYQEETDQAAIAHQQRLAEIQQEGDERLAALGQKYDEQVAAIEEEHRERMAEIDRELGQGSA